jgi:hypothetical protein
MAIRKPVGPPLELRNIIGTFGITVAVDAFGVENIKEHLGINDQDIALMYEVEEFGKGRTLEDLEKKYTESQLERACIY